MQSKHGGVYQRVALEVFEDEEVVRATVFLDPENDNYQKWEPFLAEGNLIQGVIWKDRKKKLVNGDSPVKLV